MKPIERQFLKERLGAGDVSVGAWLSSNSALNAEAMASCGFHWLAIDMEHGSTDLSQVESIFAVTEKWGVAPIVRIGEHNSHLACRLLDFGAQGLIVAKVENAANFEAFAKSCLYPPNGPRGVGLGRSNVWGDHFEDYFTKFQPVLMPMIETNQGVAQAEDIAALPYVDGLFLGPYDLSTSLGKPGEFDCPEFISAVSTIKSACDKHGKRLGIHQVAPDLGQLQSRFAEGYSFVAYGTDLLAIRHIFKTISELKD
jgi:2-dehydro-3-deoxyglucarate aldolase